MEPIDISSLSDAEKQALVCLFYARLPKTDKRYKSRESVWETLSSRYNRKATTYKNDKDAFDALFPDNGRAGWTDKPLEKRSKLLKQVFDAFATADDSALEQAVNEIVDSCNKEQQNSSFVSLRVQKPEQAHFLLDTANAKFTIDGIYTLQEAMKSGKIIFIALGGDAGQAAVDWERGFYAIGHVVREPYDIGYTRANRGTEYYKVDIQIDWRSSTPISKNELMGYPETYDAPYIGLELRRDPTQAVCQLEDRKAIAIIRAVLDKHPEDLETFKTIFPAEFMERVLGAAKVIVPISVDFGQSLEKAMEEAIVDKRVTNISEKNETISIERCKGGKNIIFYGVPGCGKSRRIKDLYGDDEHFMERVVFHPDYTNADFVGQILPKVADGQVSYEFSPGPFTRILKSAENDPANCYYLVIEEINRGNAPAIFGDIFQLLDRQNGESEYGISNADIAQEVYANPTRKIKIPSNLFILATMNTADQNVFTLDTAFKRRWTMKRIANSFVSCYFSGVNICGTTISWKSFATAINKKIIELHTGSIGNEDMRLGAYFVRYEELNDDNAFAEKVLMYLWNDVFKYERDKVFAKDILSLDILLDEFSTERKFGVFNAEINFNSSTSVDEEEKEDEDEDIKDV